MLEKGLNLKNSFATHLTDLKMGEDINNRKRRLDDDVPEPVCFPLMIISKNFTLSLFMSQH